MSDSRPQTGESSSGKVVAEVAPSDDNLIREKSLTDKEQDVGASPAPPAEVQDTGASSVADKMAAPEGGDPDKHPGSEGEAPRPASETGEEKLRPSSRSQEAARPPSGAGQEATKGRRKKKDSAPPSGHRVTFTVTIAKAIPTDEDEGEDAKEAAKKKRRIVEAPRAQNHFHYQYQLLPGDEEEPVRTDVVTFGVAAKIYTERQEPKVLKTWQEDQLTWVAWTHCHTVTVTEELLKDLFQHKLMLRVWDTKDKLSTRARFDRPKAFRLPQPKPGEDADSVGGVKALVLKQSKSFEKLQPKRSYIDRPLPSQAKDATEEVAEPVSKALAKKAKAREAAKKAAAAGLDGKTSATPRPPLHDPIPVISNTLIQTPRPPEAGEEALRSYSRLGRLAGADSPSDPHPGGAEGLHSRSRQSGRSTKATSHSPGGAPSVRSRKERRGSVDTDSTAVSKKTVGGLAARDAQATPSQTGGSALPKSRRSRRSEAVQAQATAEETRKNGVCHLAINMNKLFAGLQTVTERLSKPIAGIEDIFITVSLNGPLMSEDQLRSLNPMVIKVHSATTMPSLPLTYQDLRLRCEPAYIQYKLFNQDHHRSVGREQDENIYWDDINVFLTGAMEPSELREFLNGPPLTMEVHDRDRVPEKHKLKAALFGDDLQDEKISNVGTVTSRRTTNNPFSGRGRAWDPHGLAQFDLSDLLLGHRYLHLKAPIHQCPIPDVLGGGAKDERGGANKLMGVAGAIDGPVGSPLPSGHYLQSSSMLKVKVTLAHPLRTPSEVAANTALPTSSTCPFARMVFKFDYNNVSFLHKLSALITGINARALQLENLPHHVIEAALSTYKLSLEQQQSESLDIITGFQVLDGAAHMFVLEGLRDRGISTIWTALPQPHRQDVEVLYNSDLSHQVRLYGPLDVDLCRIKLHEPLGLIVQQPLLYVRDMVPKPCFQALVKLNELSLVDKMRDAVRSSLFPSAEMVLSMSREFGVPLTADDLEELSSERPLRPVTEASIAGGLGAGLGERQTSRTWTPIDHYNAAYLDHINARDATAGQGGCNTDFSHQYKEMVKHRSAENRLERSLTMPATLRVATDNPHNYSSQTLNTTEQACQLLRDTLNKEAPGQLYTSCHDYHHSTTVVPVDVNAVQKAESCASAAAWKTPGGWVYPGHKTMIESNKHPQRPHTVRMEDLRESWEENTLHGATLRPTLQRERADWHHRHHDFDIWTRPLPVFGHDEPITIHDAGVKLEEARLGALERDLEKWRERIVVEDTRVHFHRCAPDTEMKRQGPGASNQLAKLSGVLKDPPAKYSLRQSGLALRDIPPLCVVLNPSVDTAARAQGAPLQPAVEGEGRANNKGFLPGPYEDYSWGLERNQVPAPDYQHGRFAQIKGHDFNVYHKDRSSLYKRRISPLVDAEYTTHLFQWPTELPTSIDSGGDIPGRYYIIPDIGDFHKRHVTQDTLDSGFVSMGPGEKSSVQAGQA